jgi:hypothetical protein
MGDRRWSGSSARISGLIPFQDTRQLGNITTDLSAIVGTTPETFRTGLQLRVWVAIKLRQERQEFTLVLTLESSGC